MKSFKSWYNETNQNNKNEMWRVKRGNQTFGPFTWKQLQTLGWTNKITATDLVRKDSDVSGRWVGAFTIQALKPADYGPEVLLGDDQPNDQEDNSFYGGPHSMIASKERMDLWKQWYSLWKQGKQTGIGTRDSDAFYQAHKNVMGSVPSSWMFIRRKDLPYRTDISRDELMNIGKQVGSQMINVASNLGRGYLMGRGLRSLFDS